METINKKTSISDRSMCIRMCWDSKPNHGEVRDIECVPKGRVQTLRDDKTQCNKYFLYSKPGRRSIYPVKNNLTLNRARVS